MPIRAVVRRHGVSWGVINTLVHAWSGLIAAHRRQQRCKVLLVDETSMRKRRRYVTVIVNGDTGHNPGPSRTPLQRSIDTVFEVTTP